MSDIWHVVREMGRGNFARTEEFDVDSLAVAQHHARNGAIVTPDVGALPPYRRLLGQYTLLRIAALKGAAGVR